MCCHILLRERGAKALEERLGMKKGGEGGDVEAGSEVEAPRPTS